VAARSYSLAQNRYSYAKTCDTQSCQVYGGADQESAQAERAVVETTGQVLVDGNNRVVSTEFSSSSGGWTAGGTFPARPDDGDTISPYHDWTTQVPVSQFEQAYGVGSLIDIRVTRRNGLGADGGRVLEIQVVGTSRTVTTTGDAMRIALGLQSNWFTPQNSDPGGNYYLANVPGEPAISRAYFGAPGDVGIACDWDGNGTDTIGVFRAGTWYLRNNNASGPPDITLRFGDPGDQPVCGDFNGDGVDTVGVYRDGMVYLRNSNTTGPAEVQYAYGSPGDIAVFGDWNRTGTDTIGVFRAGSWFLSNSARPSVADGTFAFGAPNDQPITGDWNGDGYTTVGVARGGAWFLTNSNLRPTTDQMFGFGDAGDQAISGHWSGGLVDGAGVARW